MALLSLLFTLLLPVVAGKIDRHRIVVKNDIVRTSLITNTTTPLQVGNGNFAYNVDNTGMQVRIHSVCNSEEAH